MHLRYALPAMGAFFGLAAQAQPTLTAANDIPLDGMQFSVHSVEDFTSIGGGGVNVTWQYWNMLVPNTGNRDYRWFNASVTPSAALVPSASLLSTDGGTDTTFWDVDTDGLVQVGSRTNLTGGVINYTDPFTELKLPCTYLTSWTDQHAASYSVSGFPVTRTGTITGIADAYGQLQLPSNYMHDVLRVKVRRQITDATAIVTTVRIETVNYYYEAMARYPRLKLQVDSVQINGGAWAVTKRAEWTGEGFVVGLPEDFSDEDVFTAYPNPTDGPLTIEVADGIGARVEIADAAGRIVEGFTLSSDRAMIGTAHLRAGAYLVSVTARNGDRRVQRVAVQ